MGMDVYGASGNYFRANIWSWRPIHALCYRLNKQFDLKLDLTNWENNDGRGLKTQDECNRLAYAIENELSSGQEVYTMEDSLIRVDDSGHFLPMGSKEGKSPYQTDAEHIRQFVTFLRECGGSFEIL